MSISHTFYPQVLGESVGVGHFFDAEGCILFDIRRLDLEEAEGYSRDAANAI